MPTLIFRGGDGQEQRMELSTELSVGREADNDVVLNEQGVSRKHCRFFVDDAGQVWVEDLNSANGVLVGGARIGEATPVSAGDEVGIGGCVVKLAAARRSTSARVPSGARGPARPSTALARPSGGAPVKRATRMMAAGEAPVRARPVAKAPPPRDARPVLRGMAGPFQGQVFQLDKGKLTVGRVPPADIMLEDDSVSRRHAEILKTGSKFSVRDLGSANGTFLNGDRVSEAPLEPGDVVRFGVIELAFAGPGAPRAAKGAGGGGKKKLLLVVGVAALVIAVAAIVGGGGKKPVGQGPGPGQVVPPPPDAVDPAKLMGKCMAYSDPESPEYNLDSCVKVCNEAHVADPTMGAGKKVKVCKRELENEKLLVDAKRLIATGQEEEGIKGLVKVEKDAVAVFPRAKAAFTEAVSILAKKNKGACKGDVHGGYFDTAYTGSCRRVLELTCNRDEGPDEEALKWFQHAAKQLGKGKGEYKCPPEYAKFQNMTNDLGSDPKLKAEQAIVAKYPNARIAEIMLGYFNMGRPKQQSNALKNLRSKASPKDRADYSDLIMWLDLIDGRVTTAAEPLRLGKAKDAELILKEAFDADAKLMPPGVESDLVRQQKADLAKVYLDLAKEEFNKEHYDKCFESVWRGYKLNPKDTNLAGMLARMDREANHKINDNPDCDSIGFALTITAPESPNHKKAIEVGRKMGCPDMPEPGETKPEAEPESP